MHELCYKDTVTEAKAFWSSFNSFISSNSNFVLHRKKPVFNNQEVDLYRLYRTVEKRGGYAVISERKAWREVAGALQIEDKGNNAGSTLKQWYLKYLQPFKEYSVSRNACGAGMLCDAVESAIYGRDRAVGLKRERKEVSRVEELDPVLDAELDVDVDAKLDADMDVDEFGEVVSGLLDLISEGDAEAGQLGDTQSRHQAGQGREGGTPSKKEGSMPDEDEDEEVSAMVCEACRGGHYEDQVCRLMQVDIGDFPLCVTVKRVGRACRSSVSVTTCLYPYRIDASYKTLAHSIFDADNSVRQV